jgi:hypothetical protein
VQNLLTEKQKLFQIIKDKGYKWNDQTKRLEVLITPNFKVGDIIQDKDSYEVKITAVNTEDKFYEYESVITKGIGTITFNDQYDWNLVSYEIKPKFKIGDKIKHKLTGEICIVLFILSNKNGGGVYDVGITNEIGKSIDIKDQDNWELVEYQVGDHFVNSTNSNLFIITEIRCYGDYKIQDLYGSSHIVNKHYLHKYLKVNKWDPKWFKPFDKVLVRNGGRDKWQAGLFSYLEEKKIGIDYGSYTKYLKSMTTYNVNSDFYNYCIPYNYDTKHLVGTILEEPEFYKF